MPRRERECVLCGEKPTAKPLQVRSVVDLAKEPLPSRAEEAIGLLCQAIRCLQRNYEGAAWRIADALFLVGQKWPHAHGIAEPTGRGAMLKVADK